MGYFDGLVSANFKTAQDGRKLFFPWGIWGSGYVIASEEDYRRLRSQVKAYVAIGLVLIIFIGSLAGYLIQFILAGLLIAFYLIWMWRLLPRLKRSEEVLSLNESMTFQAQAFGPVVLWLLEIGSIVLVGGGILMLVTDPSNWLVALAGILFFGLCLAKITRMLVLRRRSAGGQL